MNLRQVQRKKKHKKDGFCFGGSGIRKSYEQIDKEHVDDRRDRTHALIVVIIGVLSVIIDVVCHALGIGRQLFHEFGVFV